MHAAISGTIDFREPDDDACLERLRRLVDAAAGRPMPQPSTATSRRAGRPGDDLYDLVRSRSAAGVRRPRPARRASSTTAPFDEYKAEYGQTLVCGYGRLGGVPVGVVANQRQRVQAGRRAACSSAA